jgi:erythronate-4-phosphate dehydrogenase
LNILADSDLPSLTQLFPSPFEVMTYSSSLELHALLPNADILICRSTLKVNEALLQQCHLQCVATASSGVCHIDQTYLESKHIRLLDAKGCNAHAVADYVTATLAWLESQQHIQGKRAGIIGIGAVGSTVFRRLIAAGYDVKIYDPYKPDIEAKHHVNTLNDLTQCDVICIHANLHQQEPFPSQNLIKADFLSALKPGSTLINASRGGILNEQDLLHLQPPIHYCTDVFLGEPSINPLIVDFATLCTPHIAGHSVEAKQNAMIQLSTQIHHYFDKIPPVSPIPTQDIDIIILAEPEKILAQYNPIHETLVLKSRPDISNAFIEQRKAHSYRHDFTI